MEDFKSQTNLKPYFDTAYGYAYFPTVAKGGIGIGGAGGKGIVYARTTTQGTDPVVQVGEVTMMQISFGWQFGGQVYSEMIFFESQKDFENFTSGNFEFGADANVVALTASASVKASTQGNQGLQAGLTPDQITVDGSGSVATYTKGMCVFTITKGGLMYEASISGQKFNYTPSASSSSSPA
jgi:lipid-binding SYLF domain-containing protein